MVKKKYIWVLFVLYLLILIRVIIFKYPLPMLKRIAENWRDDVFWQGKNQANLVLFKTIRLYVKHWNHLGIYSFGNLVGNVLVFVPLGCMLPLLGRRLKKCFWCLGAGLLVVLAIELFQLWSNFGCFDVDDILLNGLGVWIGWFLFKILSVFFAGKHPTE